MQIRGFRHRKAKSKALRDTHVLNARHRASRHRRGAVGITTMTSHVDDGVLQRRMTQPPPRVSAACHPFTPLIMTPRIYISHAETAKSALGRAEAEPHHFRPYPSPLMSDLWRCMQASNSDSDSDNSSTDSARSPRKRRKEKREHAHKRSPRKDKSRVHKRHKEKKHKRHKERHHSDKVASPRHKERRLTDKVASPRHKHQTHQVSPRSIDKEAKSPRSVMTDTKSGMFCPQKSRLVQESEALAERRLAAAKHCAEQREAASTYQAVVTVAPPVE